MYQNLSSYRIFYTVANTKNISKAAKELYISQPAISKSIQKLEESLGTKLFERSSRGVALTDSGELLYTHVKSAFETLSIGEDRLRRSIELGIGHLTIGVSSTPVSYTHLDVYKRQIHLMQLLYVYLKYILFFHKVYGLPLQSLLRLHNFHRNLLIFPASVV